METKEKEFLLDKETVLKKAKHWGVETEGKSQKEIIEEIFEAVEKSEEETILKREIEERETIEALWNNPYYGKWKKVGTKGI